MTDLHEGKKVRYCEDIDFINGIEFSSISVKSLYQPHSAWQKRKSYHNNIGQKKSLINN